MSWLSDLFTWLSSERWMILISAQHQWTLAGYSSADYSPSLLLLLLLHPCLVSPTRQEDSKTRFRTREFVNLIRNDILWHENGDEGMKKRFRTTFTRISLKNEIQDGYNSTRKLLMQRVYWNSHNWQKLSSSFGKNIQLSGVGEYR